MLLCQNRNKKYLFQNVEFFGFSVSDFIRLLTWFLNNTVFFPNLSLSLYCAYICPFVWISKTSIHVLNTLTASFIFLSLAPTTKPSIKLLLDEWIIVIVFAKLSGFILIPFGLVFQNLYLVLKLQLWSSLSVAIHCFFDSSCFLKMLPFYWLKNDSSELCLWL